MMNSLSVDTSALVTSSTVSVLSSKRHKGERLPTYVKRCRHLDEKVRPFSFGCLVCEGLCEAIRTLNERKVRYFLTNENADPNCLDSKGRHPLHDLHPDGSVEVAEHIRKRLAIAEMLFAFGADISTLDMRRNMLLRDFLEAWRSYKSRAHFVGTVFD